MIRVLDKVLSRVKPEYRNELKRVLETLAAKWDDLSEEEHEEYYGGDGTIGFVFETNEAEWKNLPENHADMLPQIFNNKTVAEQAAYQLDDAILDYICPWDDDDDNPFEQDWDDEDYEAELVVEANMSEDQLNDLTEIIMNYLKKNNIKGKIS